MRAISYDRGGIAHALSHTGAKTAFCGWKRFNFNTTIDLESHHYEYNTHVYHYDPPTDVCVTCLLCVRCS